MKRLIPYILMILLLITLTGCENYVSSKSSELSLEQLIEKSKSIHEYYYEYEANDSPLKMRGKIWVKDDRARIECLIVGEDEPQTTEGLIIQEKVGVVSQYSIRHNQISSTSTTYSYFKKEDESIKIRDATLLGELDQIDLTKAHIIGLETIDNDSCIVIDCGLEDSKKKLWVSKKLAVPRKVEIYGNTILYKNISLGVGSVKDKDLLQPET